MYVLSFTGDLYKIIPKSQSTLPNKQGSLQSDVVLEDSVLVTINGISGDNSYSPNPITIRLDETITWYNADTVSHTVTSGSDNDPNESQLFDSDAILLNQTYSQKFDDKGIYNYYCIYHPSMVGEVIVE